MSDEKATKAQAEEQSTEPLAQEALRSAEISILDGMLLAAKERESATQVIEIARDGKARFAFRIRAVTEEENEEALETATRYKRDKRLPSPVPIGEDRYKYRSLLIVKATVAFCEKDGAGEYRDVESMWNDEGLRKQWNLAATHEVVDKVLLPGEKERVVDRISDLSGFDLAEDPVDTAKN